MMGWKLTLSNARKMEEEEARQIVGALRDSRKQQMVNELVTDPSPLHTLSMAMIAYDTISV
jgi:hypothetical protein